MSQVLSSGRCAVNVWGAITRDGLGPLVRLPQPFNSAAYCDVIDNTLIPYALDGPFKDGCYILQQDRSPVHTSKVVQRLLEGRGVRLLEWPPNGADLNPIENVWGTMKHNLAHLNLTTATADDLWAAIKAQWETLRQKPGYTDQLYASLPRRIEDTIRVDGAFTGY